MMLHLIIAALLMQDPVKRAGFGSSAPLGPRRSDNAQQGSNVHKPAPLKFPHPADLE